MPPRDPKPANSRRKSKLKLDMPEPEPAGMLEQYCDLRRRGFDQQAIKTKASWPRHYPSLLLEEAQRHEMPGSQKSQAQAVTEWLLQMHDAGAELRVIQRTSALSNLQTKNRLQTALDNASGPTPTGLIIRNPDGEPARVSWLDVNRNLMHRPFDGAFPPNYPAELAIRQCTEVAHRLIGQPSKAARDNVAQLLLQRCGISSRWLTGNGARSLFCLMRHHEYTPALIRNLLKYMGSDPDTYYAIGPDYRIPEPSAADRTRCVEQLRELGIELRRNRAEIL